MIKISYIFQMEVAFFWKKWNCISEKLFLPFSELSLRFLSKFNFASSRITLYNAETLLLHISTVEKLVKVSYIKTDRAKYRNLNVLSGGATNELIYAVFKSIVVRISSVVWEKFYTCLYSGVQWISYAMTGR